MSGSAEDQGRPACIPAEAKFATVLLHGCRFRAHRRESHPYDILTEGGGGMHVATVHGDDCEITEENAACLAASAEMLTALVDLINAQSRGHDLPWGTARSAILAGFGAPQVGDQVISRNVERVGNQTLTARTKWRVVRVGFCPRRHVVVRIGTLLGASVELEYGLDELRLRFERAEA